ncbi:hypothetical protein PCANC_27901 [Puccinia coronata f. sp. avenae]|uniref:Uncharacterized protein n=1 Tax=Puccinia coronata f. sp. avenae TaxID=200324 RepID=A0A2N5TYB9_9BASI|nr:hypothetical protein PCANC_27901 [Puccinia coronata f. sp. avenae]
MASCQRLIDISGFLKHSPIRVATVQLLFALICPGKTEISLTNFPCKKLEILVRVDYARHQCAEAGLEDESD